MSLLLALARRWPWLRPLLPAAAIAAGFQGCTRGEGPLVAFLGDSLTSGWRLREEQAYPALVARELASRGRRIRVVNAGRSGDTAEQGLARLPTVLRTRPDVLVVALGINDALRGLPVEAAEAALGRIVEEGQAAGARVLLVGFRPAPLGAPKGDGFEAMYARLAAERRLPFVPDLLNGVSGRPERLFADGLHPNEAGQRRLAETVSRPLERLLAEIGR
jgi:acyl-CoA thioesterase-1